MSTVTQKQLGLNHADFKSLYEKNPQRFMQAIHSQKILEMNPQDAYTVCSSLLER